MAENGNKQKQLAVYIAEKANPAVSASLQTLLTKLLAIREENLPWHQKAKQALSATIESKVAWPIFKEIANAVKKHGWDKRSSTQRLGLGTAAVAFATFGGAHAGIAALGGAVGVPLWIVFGAGSMFAKMLYEELINGKQNGGIVTYDVIDAEREDD